MNPAVLLALVSDLYTQIVELRQQNAKLQAEVDAAKNLAGKDPRAG